MIFTLQQTLHVMGKKSKTPSIMLHIFLSHINAIFLMKHQIM
jgi:hypothetical protein